MSNYKTNLRLIIGSLLISIVVFSIKFYGYLITSSNIILSEALESIANVAASAFAVYSIYLASKPKDLNHPYGHGKVEFFAAGFEGGLVFLSGIAIIIKSTINFFIPQQLQQIDQGIFFLITGGMLNGMYGLVLIYFGRKNQSITISADGRHLLADTVTTVFSIAGLILTHLTNWLQMDNVFGLILGIIILRSGYRIARPAIAGLMDESDLKLLAQIREILTQHRKDDWIDLHNMRVQQYGSSIHMDCHITIPYYYSLRRSHEIMREIEVLLNNSLSKPLEIFIHSDPCSPGYSCPICPLMVCEVRQAAFQKRLDWNLEQLVSHEKHHA